MHEEGVDKVPILVQVASFELVNRRGDRLAVSVENRRDLPNGAGTNIPPFGRGVGACEDDTWGESLEFAGPHRRHEKIVDGVLLGDHVLYFRATPVEELDDWDDTHRVGKRPRLTPRLTPLQAKRRAGFGDKGENPMFHRILGGRTRRVVILVDSLGGVHVDTHLTGRGEPSFHSEHGKARVIVRVADPNQLGGIPVDAGANRLVRPNDHRPPTLHQCPLMGLLLELIHIVRPENRPQVFEAGVVPFEPEQFQLVQDRIDHHTAPVVPEPFKSVTEGFVELVGSERDLLVPLIPVPILLQVVVLFVEKFQFGADHRLEELLVS